MRPPRPLDCAVLWAATGSRHICNPPVMDTDEDILVLVDDFDEAIEELEVQDWDVNTDDPDYDCVLTDEIPFITARKGDVNLIIYEDEEGYAAFNAATSVAKHLNLTKKEDRVFLFKAVCGFRAKEFK